MATNLVIFTKLTYVQFSVQANDCHILERGNLNSKIQITNYEIKLSVVIGVLIIKIRHNQPLWFLQNIYTFCYYAGVRELTT